ncbi:MAG: hypothetical protein Q8M08_07880 [Bacteroidales bacterium]|nr:hypothetical protein [Bacteroidales bacterium]
MKKNRLIIILWFTLSAGTVNAQTMQLPAVMADNVNSFDNTIAAQTLLSDGVAADQTINTNPADKLNMIASPNPFTSQTVITCYFPEKGKFLLGIRNMFGESVRLIEDYVEQEGNHCVEVTGDNLRSGIYTAMLIFKTKDNVMMKTIRLVYSQ